MNDEFHDVLFVVDLARLLRTSTRTIERRLRAGGVGLPPELRSPDSKHRWSRVEAEAWQRGESTRRLRRAS